MSLHDLSRRQSLSHDYLEKNYGYGFCLMEYNPWKTHKVLKKIVSLETQQAWTTRNREKTKEKKAIELLKF